MNRSVRRDTGLPGRSRLFPTLEENMELGVALPTSARYVSAESIVRIAQEAERLGYTSLWTYERLLYPIAGITQPDGSTWQLPESYKSAYEPIETLSFVAALTQRIKLGTSIVNAPFQSPVLLARRFNTSPADGLRH